LEGVVIAKELTPPFRPKREKKKKTCLINLMGKERAPALRKGLPAPENKRKKKRKKKRAKLPKGPAIPKRVRKKIKGSEKKEKSRKRSVAIDSGEKHTT